MCPKLLRTVAIGLASVKGTMCRRLLVCLYRRLSSLQAVELRTPADWKLGNTVGLKTCGTIT